MAMVLSPEDCVPTYELILMKSISRSLGTGSIERTRSADEIHYMIRSEHNLNSI